MTKGNTKNVRLIVEAINNGETQTVSKLLKKGVNVNTKDKHGTTFLMSACGRGFI